MRIRSLLFCMVLLLLPVAVSAQGEPFYPDDPYFFYDPFTLPGFPGQWHLENQAPQPSMNQLLRVGDDADFFPGKNAGKDANLAGAWDLGYTGAGVVIGIMDNGVEGAHPDLAPNYRDDLSANFTTGGTQFPQGPKNANDNHGTPVAGVAAARGGNGTGGTGAAPYANIAGLRILGDNDDNQDEIRATYWESGVNSVTGVIEDVARIQVKNHSYGPDTPFAGWDENVEKALSRTAANGVIHVFSAGNERTESNEDAAKDYVNNNPDVISVAALGSDGKFASYSNYGSCVFVTAPSSTFVDGFYGITTTDRQGADLGDNRYSMGSNLDGDQNEAFPDVDYTSQFGGTSSSAPLVSGIMALGKEANPDMTVRMAKHALVRTSGKVDEHDLSDTGGWQTNRDGHGYHFNPNYGFGNINAGGFVSKVHDTAYVTEKTTYQTAEIAVDQDIPDNDPAGISQTFTLTQAELDQPLEGVVVYLNITHDLRGDLQATIKSPSTMESRLMNSTKNLDETRKDNNGNDVDNWDKYSGDWDWQFLSNAFWGEDGLGEWTLTMADMRPGNTGNWKKYAVALHMGQMVLQTDGTMTQRADIRAESLSLSNPGAIFVNPAGMTFRVMGNVNVQAGQLVVNGQIIEAPGSFGNLLRLDGGVISGAGQITASRGFYNTGGTVSPGNSIGTLTINGDYTQDPAGTLLIEVAPVDSDRLDITGSAFLAGILDVQAATGNYSLAPDYTILQAAGGVAGTFDTVTTNLAFLDPALTYNPLDVILSFTRNNMSYAGVAVTGNQQAVGSALDQAAPSTTGDMLTVLNAVGGLSAPQARSAYDQMGGASHSAFTASGFNRTSLVLGTVARRLEVSRVVQSF